jgi:hypothetical protein
VSHSASEANRREELAELPFDEAWQALSAAAQARLGQKSFEVFSNQVVEDGVFGLAADVGPTLGAPSGPTS